MTGLLTPSCMQAFASGGSLSYFHLNRGRDFHQLKYHFLVPGLMSFVYLIMVMNGFLPLLVDLRTIVSIFVVGLISCILINPNSFLSSKILGNSALVFIGKISYGVYLFHNFIPIIINAILHKLGKNGFSFTFLGYEKYLFNQGILFYSICFSILLSIATLSFYFLERPINKFKSYFN